MRLCCSSLNQVHYQKTTSKKDFKSNPGLLVAGLLRTIDSHNVHADLTKVTT